MAAIASAANGLWNTGATWTGGVVPTAADTVTITHTITLDGACDCLTGVVNSPGIVQASTAVNSELRWKGPGTFLFNAGSSIRADLSAHPSITFRIRAQYGSSAEHKDSHMRFQNGGVMSLKGAYRKRVTRVQGAQATGSSGTRNITVDDATGWLAGDTVLLASTQTGAINVNRNDRLTITGITGGPLNAVITVNLAATPIANSKLDRAYIANESSNITMADEPGRSARLYAGIAASGVVPGLIQDVAFFSSMVHGYSGSGYHTTFSQASSSTQLMTGGLINNAFSASIGSSAALLSLQTIYQPFPRIDNLFTSTATTSSGAAMDCGGPNQFFAGPDLRPAVFGLGLYLFGSARGGEVIDALMGGSPSFSALASENGTTFTRLKSWGSGDTLAAGSQIGCSFRECEFGVEFAGINSPRLAFGGAIFMDVVYEDCTFGPFAGTVISSNATNYIPGARLFMKNKNKDANQQEAYTLISATTPTFKRDTSLSFRGDASVMVQAVGATYTPQHWSSFLALPGVSYRVIGYVRYDNAAGDANPPQLFSNSQNVTITGTGASGNVFTCPVGINTWNKFDLTVSHSNAAAITLNLAFTARSSSAATVKAYFDGVPDNPWVQVARHYGFTFTGNAYRAVNISTSASEATAAGYSGITIGWGASTSSVTLNADKTFQYLYDYTQYESCQAANMLSIPPLVGVGPAGSVTIFPNGDVTTTGFSLTGTSSMSMGAYTLTASVPWVYTYTGGTFAQVSTVPSFNGGTLAIGAAGTYTFTMAGSTLVVLTPTAPSSYTLSAGSFTGTLTINNAAAHAITVYVPTGVTTSTAGNTGGAITFSSQAVLTVAGIIVGSDVVIRSAGTSTVLGSVDSNATNSWDFGYETPSLVDIDVIKPGYVPLPLVRNYMLPSTNATLPASQQVDRNYAA